MIRYLGLTTLCDATFGVFMLSWLVTRHFLFLFVIKSTYYDAPRIIPRVWDPATGHFMTKGVYVAFNAMLMSLQASTNPHVFLSLDSPFFLQILQLIWFWMIVRVAYRVVMGQGAEDTRSDSEEYVYLSYTQQL